MKLKPYPKYKDLEDNIVNITNLKTFLPSNWRIHKIKFLLRKPVTDGPHESPEFIEEGVPFLSVDSIQDGKLIFEDCRYISKDDHKRFKQKCNPKKNDVLMGKAASIGKIAIVDIDFEFSTWSPLALLRPDGKKILPKFLEYSLKSDYCQDQIDLYATSNTQKNISMDEIPRIQIITPSIYEQKEIISYIDTKFVGVNQTTEKDKQLIELLKEKRTALINHVVTKGLNPKAKMKDSGIEWIGKVPEGWEVKRLNKSAYVKRGASPRPIDDSKYFDDNGAYGWVRIEDVTASDKYLFETFEKLSTLGKSLSVPLNPGEIFISIAGSVGKPIMTKIKCCIHDGFVYFQRLKLHPDYLYYIFIGGEVYKGLGKLGTQLNLNTETIGSMKIPTPPKPEQIQIAEFLDKATSKIDQTIHKTEKKIGFLEEYKKSLIHHVVTGKVDVRGVAV